MIKYKLDLRKDEDDSRDFRMNAIMPKKMEEGIIANLPFIISYRSEMSTVKDQKSLGSCVGFATAAMKEWQEQIEHLREVQAGKVDHRKGTTQYDLSESWIYWNCKKIDPWPDQEGTSVRCAMKVLNKIGVPVEKAWPYSDTDIGKPQSWANMVAVWSLIKSYYRVSTLNELKMALANGPVVIGIACFEEIFEVGNDGIIDNPRNPNNVLGGHAICITGYNDERGLVEFKNSWSNGWGHDGYGFLSYDYIDSYMWDGWAATDISVTKEMLKGAKSLI